MPIFQIGCGTFGLKNELLPSHSWVPVERGGSQSGQAGLRLGGPLSLGNTLAATCLLRPEVSLPPYEAMGPPTGKKVATNLALTETEKKCFGEDPFQLAAILKTNTGEHTTRPQKCKKSFPKTKKKMQVALLPHLQ